MSREPLSGFPTSDIGYPIKSDRRTTSDKLYITQLLPTEYSINITNTFGGYEYNKQTKGAIIRLSDVGYCTNSTTSSVMHHKDP
jgi:hypothetical protein